MYEYKYPRPEVTADTVVFALEEDTTYILLIKRRNEPFKNCWALPGGFMNMDETADECARRELKEETGLDVSSVFQIGAYSAVDRDPRSRVVSVAFYTDVDGRQKVHGGDDAAQAEWFDTNDLPDLAFDHKQIINDAMTKRRISAML